MHAAVRQIYRVFTDAFEGTVDYMYLDSKGLVTIGIGTLLERNGAPTARALSLPFVFESNPAIMASRQDIINDFNAVKRRGPAPSHTEYKPLTKLRLPAAEMDRLMFEHLSNDEANLRNVPEFSGLDTWPADAQLGLFSMAYAMGLAFPSKYPKFRAACRAGDFARAAGECHMSTVQNPNVAPRNWADELLFTFAGRVLKLGRPIDQLVFPNLLKNDGQLVDVGLAPGKVVWPTLKLRATGRQVEVLQDLLGVTVTGTFDGNTDAAVKQFQATAKDVEGKALTPDGVVGLKSWSALVRR